MVVEAMTEATLAEDTRNDASVNQEAYSKGLQVIEKKNSPRVAS